MRKKSYVPKSPEASSYPVNLLSTPSSWRQKKKMTPKSLKDEMALQYTAGINLRITEPSERLKRAYSSLVNDHTYNKKVPQKKVREKKIDRLDQYVTEALQDVCDTNKKKKTDEQIPEHVKGTQLYKYLITPVDNRPFRTENFGHFVMSERGEGKLPKVGVGVSTTTITTTKESTKKIRLTRLEKEKKTKPPVVSVQPTVFDTQLLQYNPQQQQQLLLQQQQQQQQYSHIPQHIYYHNNPCYGYSNYFEQESLYNDRLEQIIPQITFSPPLIDITDDDDESTQLLPSFLMKPEAEWTFEDSNAYEIWWQNLPSCPYQRDGMFGMYYSSSPVVFPSNN